VSSKTMQRILQSSREYVVDYDFVDNNILVASYSGPNGKNAKLLLLDNDGDTLAMQKLPEEPLSLFKSCVGKYYCVCYGKFYPLNIDSGSITLGQPYENKYLPSLKQCQLFYAGNLYYKIVQPDSFLVTYGFITQGDTVLHVFLKYYDSLAFRASREEDVSRYTEDERIWHQHKFDMGYAREPWDKGLLKMIDVPLYIKDDSLLVFDFRQKQIRYFNWIGAETKQTPISFANARNFNAEVIKDLLTERFYLHSSSAAPLQTINEIKMNTGDLDYRNIRMQRPFAQNIKVHNGYIYFLWQDNRHNATRQLFVQKGL